MAPEITPSDFVQTDPGLGVLRMAALLAEGETEPDEDELNLLYEQVDAGLLVDTSPAAMWPELARGLMGRSPAIMIRTLRECGALPFILPEVADLFGVPDISDAQGEVDLGKHLLRALNEAAARAAPLEARFALLVMNVGKSDSPREHLPVHYKHVDRGRPRIEEICRRFNAPAECLDLALLALSECERVHRVSRMRAGPVAEMLDRLGAFDDPGRFRALVTLCASDFCAHPGRAGQPYPKAQLLDLAVQACAEIDRNVDKDALTVARAEAIAQAFRSQRWSNELA